MEVQVLNLENQLAKLQSIVNLKASLECTRQVLAGASTEADVDTRVQVQEKRSWVTAKRGKGKSYREASPELAHHNKYTLLRDVGETSQGTALLEQRDSPSWGKNSPVRTWARLRVRKDRFWR